jgi:amidophosphoribosyltransferase
MCGVLGVCGRENAVYDLYQGLVALQHRGQDSAGIITYDEMFHLKKGNGLVAAVFSEKNVARLVGTCGIGHVRYPTIGAGSDEDAQPFYVNVPFGIAMAHNGNVTNYYSLRKDLAARAYRQLNSYSDVEAILNVFADEVARQDIGHFNPELVFRAVQGVFDRVEGSFSCVALIAGQGMVAFRDPFGIKPLIMGRKKRATASEGEGAYSYAFASESVAFDLLEYEVVRDVRPGEVIFVDAQQQVHTKQLTQKAQRACIFEWVYFARPDSVMDGIGVYDARRRLGERLAQDCRAAGIEPDVVVAVPETGRAAGVALAKALNVDLLEGLIKNRYIARTFIMGRQEDRKLSVRQKLNPVRSVINGRKILLVDDSIVRGTTSREIVSLVRNAGAREVYFAVTSPPLRYPCVYGIDMMTRGEFIARDQSIAQITETIGADRVVYQSYEGLITAVQGEQADRKFCTACFNGDYPTPVTEETFCALERERCRWRE